MFAALQWPALPTPRLPIAHVFTAPLFPTHAFFWNLFDDKWIDRFGNIKLLITLFLNGGHCDTNWCVAWTWTLPVCSQPCLTSNWGNGASFVGSAKLVCVSLVALQPLLLSLATTRFALPPFACDDVFVCGRICWWTMVSDNDDGGWCLVVLDDTLLTLAVAGECEWPVLMMVSWIVAWFMVANVSLSALALPSLPSDVVRVNDDGRTSVSVNVCTVDGKTNGSWLDAMDPPVDASVSVRNEKENKWALVETIFVELVGWYVEWKKWEMWVIAFDGSEAPKPYQSMFNHLYFSFEQNFNCF